MVRAESLHRHALLHISSEGYVRWFFLMWPAMICPAGAEARQSGALATVLDTSNLCCLPASCSFWHVANAFPPQLLNNGEGHCSHHQACLHQSPASQSCRAHKRPPDTQQRLRQLPQISIHACRVELERGSHPGSAAALGARPIEGPQARRAPAALQVCFNVTRVN